MESTKFTEKDKVTGTTEYDSKGWAIANYRDSDHVVWQGQYPVIDSKGNWTTQVDLKEVEKFGEKVKVVASVVYREISYFK